MKSASFLQKHPWLTGVMCLCVIILFHSPRWWILAKERPGTVEWDRGLNYFKQCESPLREDVEPALRWRFIPQVLVHGLGSNRGLAIIFPWLGSWALLTYILNYARSQGCEERVAVCLALYVGASAPVLVSTGWLGINDAWVALGLCYLSFGQNSLLLIISCILCPFIDERFVFGIPGAIAIRSLELIQTRSLLAGFGLIAFRSIVALLPFLLVRSIGAFARGGPTNDVHFWVSNIRASSSYLYMTPLACWMAFRFGYFPAMKSAFNLWVQHRAAAITVAGATIIPIATGFLLASDTMRTAGILISFCVWGAVKFAKEWNLRAHVSLALASLIVPAAHITYSKAFIINSLPVELWRLLR